MTGCWNDVWRRDMASDFTTKVAGGDVWRGDRGREFQLEDCVKEKARWPAADILVWGIFEGQGVSGGAESS